MDALKIKLTPKLAAALRKLNRCAWFGGEVQTHILYKPAGHESAMRMRQEDANRVAQAVVDAYRAGRAAKKGKRCK